MRRRGLGGALALAWAAVWAAGAAHAQQSVAQVIDVQGRVSDGAGQPITGLRDLTFRIFGALSGGTALWAETQPGFQVSAGVFSTQLGSVQPIPPSVFTSSERYLELQVGTEVMAPRKRLVTSPYAMNAAYLDGKDLGFFVMKDTATGHVGIGTSASARLHVRKAGAGAAVLLDNSSSNGEVLRLVSGGDSSSLTVETDSIYSSRPLNIGNGQSTLIRTDIGGSVGVGTTSPAQKLHVNGNLRASQFCLGTGACQNIAQCAWTNYAIRADQQATQCANGGAIVAWDGGTYPGTFSGLSYTKGCAGSSCNVAPTAGSILCCTW